MTPTLIACVLQLPLNVRLALLDADPTGIGILIPANATCAGNGYVVMSPTPYERSRVTYGAAWLPCNPLEIAEHAARLLFGEQGWSAAVASRDTVAGRYRAHIIRDVGGHERSEVGSDAHTAAVRLLAGVVGG